MDRLTKERVEQLCYELDAHTTVPEEEVLALRDLALRSLSQEAVRWHCGLCHGLIVDNRCSKCNFDYRPATTATPLRKSSDQEAVRDEALEEAASVDQREVELRGWREAIRVLKRDPNAVAEPHEYVDAPTGAIEEHGPAPAAPNYDDGDPAKWPPSGPAAPDVASMVKRLRNCCTMIGYATSGAERTSHKRNADAAEAALLAKVGQGWIPMDRTAEYQEHHFKVEDVGVAWNGNRVWVCADSGALLRAKVIGEKLFVEFTPPAPGASDE